MSDRSAEEDVFAIEDMRYSAMLRADVAALAALLDDELTYAHSNGLTQNKQDYLAEFRVRRYESIQRDDVKIIIRNETALVYCRLHIKAVVREAPRDVRTFALAVWSRTAGSWRLLALHSIAQPQ
jgi:hypothetical protein